MARKHRDFTSTETLGGGPTMQGAAQVLKQQYRSVSRLDVSERGH